MKENNKEATIIAAARLIMTDIKKLPIPSGVYPSDQDILAPEENNAWPGYPIL